MSGRFFGVGCMVPGVENPKDPADWIAKVRDAFDAVPSIQKFKAIGIDDLDFCWTGNGYTEPEGREIHIPESGIITFDERFRLDCRQFPCR